MTAQHFDQSEMYASMQHNRSGLFEWEQQISDRFFRRGSRVLVAGAGGGREVLALRKSGFEAEGFECSLCLVEASQKIFHEAGESNYIVHCPPDCVPAGPAAFDALMVGWGVYTHVPTRARRIRFLQALRKRALPNAPLLISFFARPAFSTDDLLAYRVARFWSSFSPERKSTLQVGDRISYARYVHYFAECELMEELAAAGFRVAHFAAEGELAYAVGLADEALADRALDLS